MCPEPLPQILDSRPRVGHRLTSSGIYSSNDVDMSHLGRGMSGRIDVPRRVGVGVQIAVQRRRITDLAQVRVLGKESSEFGIEVAGYDRLRRLPVTNDLKKPGTLTGLAVLRPDARPREGPENPRREFPPTPSRRRLRGGASLRFPKSPRFSGMRNSTSESSSERPEKAAKDQPRAAPAGWPR